MLLLFLLLLLFFLSGLVFFCCPGGWDFILSALLLSFFDWISLLFLPDDELTCPFEPDFASSDVFEGSFTLMLLPEISWP
ncbi:MAG TPA: hypothetical protein DD791_14995 [Syntrophomonas sp.]|nr:hypothetical protein [Syntrophomonas sp.]